MKMKRPRHTALLGFQRENIVEKHRNVVQIYYRDVSEVIKQHIFSSEKRNFFFPQENDCQAFPRIVVEGRTTPHPM